MIRSDTRRRADPITAFAEGVWAAELFARVRGRVADVEGFSHLYLIFVLDRAGSANLVLKPFMQDVERGVFATRAPRRPNPIGLSIVRLVRREGSVLHLDGVDMLDGTPVLDIKPYTAKFDRIETTRNGWQDDVDPEEARRLGRRGYKGTALQARMNRMRAEPATQWHANLELRKLKHVDLF